MPALTFLDSGLLTPALFPVLGALVMFFAPRALRPALCVALPAAALIQIVVGLPQGTHASLPFLGYELVPVRADKLSLLFGGIFALVGSLAGVYGWLGRSRVEQAASLLYTGGAIGVAFAGDYVTLYLFWELMALASALLIACRRDRGTARVVRRYLLTHLVGGALLLGGILLAVHASGSIAFLPFDPGSGGTAAWWILAAFCLNAAVPPLGAWLPDAYPRATASGAVFCSALTTKSAVYVLLRAYTGWDVLIVLGVVMALYGVVYAVLANDIRELLAYHIISQVGYMLAGCGLGTALAVNGAAAHAVCHILYKSLLFMGAGAVLHTTGRCKLTELGGLLKHQRLLFGLYMVGAFSISGFPLFNGFVSKSMVVAAAAEQHVDWAFLLLMLASVGTFLHTGLKLPYGVWLAEDRGLQPTPVPRPMLLAMGAGALLCVFIGVAPGTLYALLPHPTGWSPYTATHLVESVQVLGFTFFAFTLLIPMLGGERTLSIDTDVLYRKPARLAWRLFVELPGRVFDASLVGVTAAARRVVRLSADPAAWVPDWFAPVASHEPGYEEDRARLPLAWSLGLTLLTLVAVAASVWLL